MLRDDDNPNHIKIEWAVSNNVLKNDSGRVYIFTVNDEIYKIGGSQAKDGIIATMSFYINSMTGNPGLNRYGMHLLIKEELDMGNKVSIYLIESEKVMAPVKGLFDSKDALVSTFKEMEARCISDYKNAMGRFPAWNFQESKTKWCKDITESYDYNKNSKK